MKSIYHIHMYFNMTSNQFWRYFLILFAQESPSPLWAGVKVVDRVGESAEKPLCLVFATSVCMCRRLSVEQQRLCML
jgi:hypothetical protein